MLRKLKQEEERSLFLLLWMNLLTRSTLLSKLDIVTWLFLMDTPTSVTPGKKILLNLLWIEFVFLFLWALKEALWSRGKINMRNNCSKMKRKNMKLIQILSHWKQPLVLLRKAKELVTLWSSRSFRICTLLKLLGSWWEVHMPILLKRSFFLVWDRNLLSWLDVEWNFRKHVRK